MKEHNILHWTAQSFKFSLRFLMCVSCLLLSVEIAHSQLSPYITELNRQSMNPASLSKGLPSISIPLFEIEFGGEKIPFVLSYHASGIRVNQTSGEVGLGWSISPNFRVTERTNTDVPNIDSIASLLSSNTGFSRDSTLAKFVLTDGRLPNVLLKEQMYKGEYGISSYVLADRTGSFIRLKRDSILMLDDHKNHLNIVRKKENALNYNDPFYIIRDDRGWKYKFGENEIGDGDFINVVNWPVSQIHAPNNDALYFHYGAGVEEVRDSSFYASINVVEGRNNGYTYSPLTTVSVDTAMIGGPSTSSRRISRIDHSKGSIYYGRLENGLLTKMTVSDLGGGSQKEVYFHYSQENGKTFLDSVTFYGAPEVYRFEYYKKGDALYSSEIANRKFAVDHGGYYLFFTPDNFRGRDEIPSDLLTELSIYNVHSQSNPSQNTDAVLGSIMFDYNIVQPRGASSDDIYMLKKITQREGGSTQYVYEPHLISGGVYSPGLRIAEIYSNDGVNGITMHKRYTYGENGSGWGHYSQAYSNLINNYVQQKAVIGGELNSGANSITNWSLFNRYLISNSPGYLSQQSVYYTKVVEEYINAEEKMGKTEYIYSQATADGVHTLQTNPLPNIGGRGQLSRTHPPTSKADQYPGKEPLLLDKNYYKKQAGVWKKVKGETSIYQQYINTEVPYLQNLVVKQYASMGGWPTQFYSTSHLNEESIYGVANIQSFFDYGFYNIYTNWSKLISTKVTEYHD